MRGGNEQRNGGDLGGKAVLVADREGAEAEAFGRLDALVTSAGISLSRPYLQTSLEPWQETLDVHLEQEMIFESEEEE